MFPIMNIDASAIEAAIKAAELRTSGEIRVCIERRPCKDVERRAQEMFTKLNMDETEERNGVLLYVHLRQHELVVLGDSGINEKVLPDFWQQVCHATASCFTKKELTVGVILGIMLVAEELAKFFPYQTGRSVNALPDTIGIEDDL